jgi:hypothetical protein
VLDLDAIASRRAEKLAQEKRTWLDAVWSAGFQALSARLTDGEVMEILSLCASADELVKLTAKLGHAPGDAGRTPFEWFKDEAARLDQTVPEYVRQTVGRAG